MDDDSSLGSSSNSSSTPSAAASRQLVRRLNGIGRPYWSVTTDKELVRHLSVAHTLPDLDILSDCIARMAEHIQGAGVRPKREFFCSYIVQSGGYLELCITVDSALQQLAQGLQQQLQHGQLPAALTQRAVEACCALCAVLTWVCGFAFKHHNDDMALRSQFHGINSTSGELGARCFTGLSCDLCYHCWQ
jgi:hypothetical protein